MSSTVIAYNFAQKVPVAFESLRIIEYAQLEAMSESGDCATMLRKRRRREQVLSVHIADEKWHEHVLRILREMFNDVCYCAGEEMCVEDVPPDEKCDASLQVE